MNHQATRQRRTRLPNLVLLLLGCSLAVADDAVPPDPPPPSAIVVTNQSGPPPKSGPERLEKEIRIVVATNQPAATGGKTNATPKDKSFQWNFSWRGWDGLHMEAVQQTHLQTPTPVWRMLGVQTNAMPILHLEQVKLSGNFGARVEVDGAAFATTGDLTGFDNGVELRRLLLYARGDCILLLPFSYYLELGLNGDRFALNKSYLRFANLDYIGALQIGQFQPTMGLQIITSSRDITFMEPAAPLQAIAPGTEAGLQIGRPVFEERGTWHFGLFAPGAGHLEYGNASENYGSAILRFTALPLWHAAPADPAANRYLHLGLSANILYSANSTVRYQSRPESFIAPIVIDTGNIDANSAATFGGEAAWVNGPLSVQGEFIYSHVNQNTGSELNLYGVYGEASWYLTGESRPYDPQKGAFQRLVPLHNFDFGRTGWGAWELAARFSYTDLTDANISGGRLSLLMTGVNWYLHPHVRWMFNYGMGRVSDTAQAGNLFIFQTRIGVDF